jgi:hypothetical protein
MLSVFSGCAMISASAISVSEIPGGHDRDDG